MMTLNIETLIKIKQTNQNQQNKIKQNKNSTKINKQRKITQIQAKPIHKKITKQNTHNRNL